MEIPNSYWAGIFDGEGNIYFAKDLVHIKVGVAQKEPGILYLLKTRFGGNVYQYGEQPTPHWECFNKQQTTSFLKAIVPYLIIKKVEAEIALEALSGWLPSRNYPNGMNPAMRPEERARRQGLKDRFDADRADPKTSPIT